MADTENNTLQVGESNTPVAEQQPQEELHEQQVQQSQTEPQQIDQHQPESQIEQEEEKPTEETDKSIEANEPIEAGIPSETISETVINERSTLSDTQQTTKATEANYKNPPYVEDQPKVEVENTDKADVDVQPTVEITDITQKSEIEEPKLIFEKIETNEEETQQKDGVKEDIKETEIILPSESVDAPIKSSEEHNQPDAILSSSNAVAHELENTEEVKIDELRSEDKPEEIKETIKQDTKELNQNNSVENEIPAVDSNKEGSDPSKDVEPSDPIKVTENVELEPINESAVNDDNSALQVTADSNPGSNNEIDDLFSEPPSKVDNNDSKDIDFPMENGDQNEENFGDDQEEEAEPEEAEAVEKELEKEKGKEHFVDTAKASETADNLIPGSSDSNKNEVQKSIPGSNLQTSNPLESSNAKRQHTIAMSSTATQTHTIVLPSHSSWFNLSTVHDIERESLPEFFQGVNKNKTPEIYMKYRNFMVNSYRLNPNDYLSFTAVRRNLIGDAGALLRLHKFLTKWGLINYQVNPETKPKQIDPPYTGDFVIDYDTPRGMFPFESYKPPTEFPNLDQVKSILGTQKRKIDETDTSDKAGDVKRQKIIKPDINKYWTEHQLKKLIEAVARFKNDWYKISEFVGNSKTPDDCIIRFLQLPMEDKFLEENKELLGPLKYVPNLSFSPNDNPIMSTLSFLVNMVDTDIAVAASNRAIKVMDKKLEKKLNRFKNIKPENNSEKESVTAENQENNEQTKEQGEDPLKDIKDAAVNSFGIIGARSHLFATFEEREMHKSLVNIIQHQLKIVDMKLSKLTSLEKEFELQKKHLEKKSNELLEEKLSIFKYNNAATSKFLQIISLLESKDNFKDVEVQQIKDLISQSKEILYKPPRKQLNVLEEGEGDEAGENVNEAVKPISFEAPMLYRYWSG